MAAFGKERSNERPPRLLPRESQGAASKDGAAQHKYWGENKSVFEDENVSNLQEKALRT